MTKRFLSASATAVVTTKMINTPAGRFTRDAATARGASRFPRRDSRGSGDTCLRWATGRAGNQSTGIG
jgi:hypothetical protein